MKRVTANLGEDMAELLSILCEREGYRSPTEAFESFLAHWALSQQPHLLTGKWAAFRGFQRDKLGRELLALVKSNKNKKGSWLKARIYDAIKELNGPEAQTPTVNEVVGALPEVTLKKLEKEFG